MADARKGFIMKCSDCEITGEGFEVVYEFSSGLTVCFCSNCSDSYWDSRMSLKREWTMTDVGMAECIDAV